MLEGINLSKFVISSFTAYRAPKGTFKIEEENEFFEGDFRLMISYNDSPTKEIKCINEKILAVKRKCSSLTGFFPSGIITVFTWTLLGKAARHEYSIIYTENHILCIEVANDGSKTKRAFVIHLKIYSAKTLEEKAKAESKFESNKWYCRSLCTLKGDSLFSMEFSKLYKLIKLFISIARKRGGYHFLDSNCKCLSRSILYYFKKELDCDYVFYSLIGSFTDKPFYAFHVDMILIEKGVLQLAKGIPSELKKTILGIKDLIEKSRQDKICEENV